MAEYGDKPPIDELKAALDAYEEVRKGWREVAILLRKTQLGD